MSDDMQHLAANTPVQADASDQQVLKHGGLDTSAQKIVVNDAHIPSIKPVEPTLSNVNQSPILEAKDAPPPKMTTLQWMQHRLVTHKVRLPSVDELITDAEEIKFAVAFSLREDLQPKPAVGITADNIMPMRKHKARRAQVRVQADESEESEAALRNLLYVPIAAAAAEVGLPKNVVQRWITDGQVAFIRPQPNNSHRLVDMKDLRQCLQQKRMTTEKSQIRVLVYALVSPAHVLHMKVDDDAAAANLSEAPNKDVIDQIRDIATAMHLESGKYMYNGDVAEVDDFSQRPHFDLMLDKVISRMIHTIVVQSPDHLVLGSGFMLLKHLCQRYGVTIKCASEAATGAAAL